MSSDSIRLSRKQVNFLMESFSTNDPDVAIEKFVELLVFEGINPMQMGTYIERMMRNAN